MKICIGIVSYLPDDKHVRIERQNRLNRLLKQLETFGPDFPILFVSQNWKDFKPVITKNKQEIFDYEPLGIIKARKTLENLFLTKTNYDFIILCDDDCIIEAPNDSYLKYIEQIKNHPNSFCFIKAKDHQDSKYCPYASAQLNLCALSRNIISKEPMPYIDAQKNEGYEDRIYSTLLHHKYPELEFDAPADIRCVQFKNENEPVASTGWNERSKVRQLDGMTEHIEDYITTNNEIPDVQNLLSQCPKFIEDNLKKANDGSERLSVASIRQMLDSIAKGN